VKWCDVEETVITYFNVVSQNLSLQNRPAIATKLLLLLYFSQHVSAPMGHLQVEYNINYLSKVTSMVQKKSNKSNVVATAGIF
jgi:hypothetical protein